MTFAVLTLLAIEVTVTPLPDIASPLRGYSLYSVYACSAEEVSVSGLAIEAAAAARVRVVPRAIAAQLIARRTSERWQSRVLRVGAAATAAATAITAGGLVTASTKTISALALATTAAPEIGSRLRATIHAFDPATLVGPDSIEIRAGGCATGLLLGARSRSGQAIILQIEAKRRLRFELPAPPPAGSDWGQGSVILTNLVVAAPPISSIPEVVRW